LSRAASAKPALAIAVYTAAGMLGGASGPVLTMGVTSSWGFDGLLWIALPAFVAAALFLGLAPRSRGNPERVARAPGLGLPSLRGQLGRLTFVALCANLAVLTFLCAMPVWLVSERGLPHDSPLIGLTLAVFSAASAVGGIAGGVLTRWFRPRDLVALSLTISLLALEGVFLTTPGSVSYFIAVSAAGALLFVSSPLVVDRAQAESPGNESAVAGLLLGGTSGVAGLLYAGLGAAQGTFGTGLTMATTFLVVIPAAHVAAGVFGATGSEAATPAVVLVPQHCAGC
jgi:FSR family fosmidomycin resistance protein-like MFS transporter